MFKRILAVVGIGSLMMVSLVGCSTGSTESDKTKTVSDVLTSVQENLASKSSYSMSADLDVALIEKSTGQNLSASFTSQLDATIIKEPETTVHTVGSIEMNFYGEDYTSNINTYTTLNDTGYTTYAYDEDQLKWGKTEGEGVSNEFNSFTSSDFLLDRVDSLSMTEDKDAGEYTISGSFTGDDLSDIISCIAGTGSLADDFSVYTVDIEYYVDSETLLPTEMLLSISSNEGETHSDSDTGLTSELDHFDFDLNFTGFDNVDALKIPDEALNTTSTIQSSED